MLKWKNKENKKYAHFGVLLYASNMRPRITSVCKYTIYITHYTHFEQAWIWKIHTILSWTKKFGFGMTYEAHLRTQLVRISYPIKQEDPTSTRYIAKPISKSNFLCPFSDNYKEKILKELNCTSVWLSIWHDNAWSILQETAFSRN